MRFLGRLLFTNAVKQCREQRQAGRQRDGIDTEKCCGGGGRYIRDTGHLVEQVQQDRQAPGKKNIQTYSMKQTLLVLYIRNTYALVNCKISNTVMEVFHLQEDVSDAKTAEIHA